MQDANEPTDAKPVSAKKMASGKKKSGKSTKRQQATALTEQSPAQTLTKECVDQSDWL